MKEHEQPSPRKKNWHKNVEHNIKKDVGANKTWWLRWQVPIKEEAKSNDAKLDKAKKFETNLSTQPLTHHNAYEQHTIDEEDELWGPLIDLGRI